MEKLVFIYLEGNDSKVTVFEKDRNKLKLIKAESLSASPAVTEKIGFANILDSYEQVEMFSLDGSSEEASSGGSIMNTSFARSLNKALTGGDLRTMKFIPILTEPAVYYQKVEDEKDLEVLRASFNGREKDHPIETIEASGKTKLAVYPSGKSSYIQSLNSLAKMNSLRFLKIASVKSAEISLSEYVAEKEKFEEEDISLILYTGKDYSKLIFMKGRKILHLGSTVSAGKNTVNSYYVIMSKILLEMENASIHALNRIIVAGEDTSSELIRELGHSYPEADVSLLKINEYNLPQGNSGEQKEKDKAGCDISAFSVNIAAAEEYIKEKNSKTREINLLPGYITEEQRSFGWESYTLFFLIFAVVFAFTRLIMDNSSQIKRIETETLKYQKLQAENRELTDQINSRRTRVANYSKSQAVLGRYSQNSYPLSTALEKISGYVFDEGDIWFTSLYMDAGRSLKLSGYALNRSLLTKLSYSYNNALLSDILYEPLRNFKAYKFNLSTTADNGSAADTEKDGVKK